MNKLLPLCLLAVFTTVPLKAQLPPTTAQETPRKEWFGDIFIGYSFRMGRPDPSIVNRFGSRSGFKLGADINRIIKNRPVALGIQAEWTTYSMTSRISSAETAKTRIHTIYIAPALTFLQPLRNGGTLYEEITIGYVNYNELMRDIDVAGFKNLRGHADTWGVKEAVMSEEDMPEWGSQEERGIEMEITTAAAVLAGGSDAVILRHPEAIKTIAAMIRALI